MMLKIGSFELQKVAALEIDQSYEPLGGESIFRTVSGRGIKQTSWRKTRISTSGSGWMPAGLESLDTTVQHVLSCIVPRCVPASLLTRQALLPAARRTDAGHLPWGIAILADGSPVVTGISVSASHIATIDEVAGAVAYQAMYLPEFTVWVSRPTDSGTPGDAGYAWQLVAEEV